MKNLIEKYNQPKTTLVVSSYPDRKDGIKKLNAVAWYAEKTLKNLSRQSKNRFVILAEITNGPEMYQDGNLLIIRCWKRNHPSIFIDLFQQIRKFPQAQTVVLEFEFNTFGGMVGTAVFPLLLATLKLLRKKIILELHQVILDINALSGHLNLEKNGPLTAGFNFALRTFYQITGLLADKVVVLEGELKKRLATLVDEEKITPLFIATTPRQNLSQLSARKKLGLKKNELVLLYFGFVTWYKGADWLIRECQGKKLKLIIAGGQSPTLSKKLHYQNFYQRIVSLVKKTKNVKITGFVPDDQVALYFAACDLVVLPYRAFMSSSGPLSFALTYRKPFIISRKLEGYFLSEDFQEALNQSGLKKEELIFDLNTRDFHRLLKNINLRKLKKFSNNIAQMRSPENLAKMYLKEFKDAAGHTNPGLFSHFTDKLRARYLAYRLG